MYNLLESRQEPIPGYRLIERLGRGGYGDVWKVEAPGGFHKAMKFVFGVLGDEAEATADQELDALRRLVQIRHPFILSVERCDIVDGQVLITMELADRSLEDRYKERKAAGEAGIPRDELLRYMAEAAEALDLLALEYRLQHLDIKPTNLFLVRKHVKVGDFGLVRHLDDFEAPIRSGLTPLYAPPESYDGIISLNSDQYSLALVYHEMLTGKRAIDGESGRELMFRTLVTGPDLSEVQEPERSILAKALAKKPRDRYGSCQEFVEALTNCAANAPTLAEIAFDDDAARDHFERSTLRPRPPSETLPPSYSPLQDTPSNRQVDRTPTKRQRRFNIHELASSQRPDVSADGMLQPTLVVCLGGFGVRMGERVRSVLEGQFGEAAVKLPVHVLHLDVDPESLRKAQALDGAIYGAPAPFVCRLRKAAEYRGDWDSSKHISSWLDQEQIFRIGLAGETRGLRSLGRLALVDNFERVAQQIVTSLGALLSPETAEEVLHSTGLRYRRAEPSVYVAAGMGGGAGGGMAIDVAYLIRAVLRRAGFENPQVRLALAAGIDPSRDRDLQIANQFALANDLAAFFSAESEYVLPIPFGDIPESIAGPPADAVLLFDAEAEHLAEPHDRAVLESFAEYVIQSATGGHELFASEQATEPFVGLGWFSLVHSHDLVLRAAGCEFALCAVNRWLQPLDEEETEARRRFAREFFESHGYEPAKVAESLKAEVDADVGGPIHARAAERVNKLIEALDVRGARKRAQSLVTEARAELRRMLGGDPVDDDEVYDSPSAYESVFRDATARIADRLFEPIRNELEYAVENTDRRFGIVRGAWTGFSDALAGLIKRLTESQKTRDFEREAYETAYQLHKQLVLGALPREFVAAVEQWVRAKLEHNGRLKLIGLYQLLKAKIDALAVQVFTAPRKLETAKQRLVDLREEALAASTSLVRQAVFPRGAVSVVEALDGLTTEIGAVDLDALEEILRSEFFAPAGGIWQACAREDIAAEEIADGLAGWTATWLLQRAPMRDAADVFLERHRDNPEGLQQELAVFQEWSAPTFAPSLAAGNA